MSCHYTDYHWDGEGFRQVARGDLPLEIHRRLKQFNERLKGIKLDPFVQYIRVESFRCPPFEPKIPRPEVVW